MTAMRVAHDYDPSKVGPTASEPSGPYRNPASSYQTATPQQLQAAGIQPIVMNDRLVRQKSSTLNSFPVYNPNTSYPDHHLVGQSQSQSQSQGRQYNYDDISAPLTSGGGLGLAMNTSSYAKSPSTAGHGHGASYQSHQSNHHHHHQQQHHQHQQQGSSGRGAAAQFNSVEDVKEMTRLRMLMNERDAIFDGTSDAGSIHRETSGSLFTGMPSGESFDSYDFSPSGLDVLASPTHKSQYGPSHTQHQQQLQQHQHQQSKPYGHNSREALHQSASVGGLGIRGTHASGMGQSSSSLGYGQQSSTVSPYQSHGGVVGSTVRPGVHQSAHGMSGSPSVGSLSLTGSSVIGSRQPLTDRPLAPLVQSSGSSYGTGPATSLYGSSYQRHQQQNDHQLQHQRQHQPQNQLGLLDRGELDAGLAREPPRASRGIERELMLSSQLSSSGLGLTGGIDRVERALNGHSGHPSLGGHHGLFENDRLHGQQDSQHHYRNNITHNNSNSSFNSYGLASTTNQRSDLSLSSLLGPPEPSPFHGGSNGSMDRDLLFDVLGPRPGHSGLSSAQTSQLSLSPLQVHENHNPELKLQPLTHAPKLSLDALEIPSPASTSSRRESHSTATVHLAPLTSAENTPEKGTPTTVRKLSTVPKAATFNTVDSCKKGTSPRLCNLSDASPLSASDRIGRGDPASSPPHRVEAFADQESCATTKKLSGIASPSADEEDDKNRTSPSPLSRRFPMLKAHTTSRLPIETNASCGPAGSNVSPKLLIFKNKINSSGEHTPPPSGAMDRTISDSSGGMLYLASEMAEMVLDTPSQANKAYFQSWDDRDYSGHFDELEGRDYSNDNDRIMSAMNSDMSENSVSNIVSSFFKRSNSLTFNE